MGLSVRAAMRMIVRELNSVGGLLGQPVELVERDDRADPETGKKVAAEIIKEKVLVTIGYCNTGVATASIGIYQDAKVPLIVPVATGSLIANKFAPPASDQNFIFRTAVPDVQQVAFMVKVILKNGWQRVGLMADTSGYGEFGRKDLEAELAKHKLQVAHMERFPTGIKDLRPHMERARAAGVDVLFTYTTGPENALISQARADMKWKIPHIGPWTVGFGNHLSAAGAAADGALTAQTFIQDGQHNFDRQAFLRNVTRELGTDRVPCAMCAAQAYDAMQLVIRAIGQLRTQRTPLTPLTMRDALENLNEPVRGMVTVHQKPFSREDHEAVSQNMLVLGVVKDGKVRFANASEEIRSLIPQRKNVAEGAR